MDPSAAPAAFLLMHTTILTGMSGNPAIQPPELAGSWRAWRQCARCLARGGPEMAEDQARVPNAEPRTRVWGIRISERHGPAHGPVSRGVGRHSRRCRRSLHRTLGVCTHTPVPFPFYFHAEWTAWGCRELVIKSAIFQFQPNRAFFAQPMAEIELASRGGKAVSQAMLSHAGKNALPWVAGIVAKRTTFQASCLGSPRTGIVGA